MTLAASSALQFCNRCGAENPNHARHCGTCGSLLEESEHFDAFDESPSPAAVSESATPVALCVRCSSPLKGSDTCRVCGTLQPLPDYASDPYLSDALGYFPSLLRSPVLTADRMQYLGDIRGLLQPAFLFTVAVMIGWLLFRLPSLFPQWPKFYQFDVPPLSWGSLGRRWGMMMLVTPWLWLGYCALVQGRAMLAGGTGTFERVVRLLTMLWAPLVIIVGGWIAFVQLSKMAVPAFQAYLDDPTNTESYWWPVYYVLPLICVAAALLTVLTGIVYQIIITARANFFDTGRSILLHILELGLMIWITISYISTATVPE